MDKKLILNEIQNYYKFKKDVEFANHLGITSQMLSNWKSRNTYDAELLFTKCENINAEWLLTGKGSMIKNLINTQEPMNYEKLWKSSEYTISLQREKIEDLENRLLEMKKTDRSPILYKSVAEPEPKLGR